MKKNGLGEEDAIQSRKMMKSGKIYDHTNSGQLRRRGRNRINTESMMMMMTKRNML